MNGFIAEQGLKAEILTPINSAVTTIIKQVDLGQRSPSPVNFEEVLKLSETL